MRNTVQTLDTAIAALRCLDPDRPASLDELTTLSAARDCIDELLSTCVEELRSDSRVHHSWAAIAYALGSSSQAAVRKKYGTLTADVDAESDDQVATFWRTFAARFVWDLLPVDFLHALYVQWMMQGAPETPRLPKKAFTRRLRTAAAASGSWCYTRARPGVLMVADEPLAALPSWTRVESDAALYGLRRTSTM